MSTAHRPAYACLATQELRRASGRGSDGSSMAFVTFVPFVAKKHPLWGLSGLRVSVVKGNHGGFRTEARRSTDVWPTEYSPLLPLAR